MTGQGATLRILERADKEIMKLSRSDRGAVWEFVSKFRTNRHNPGLQFKQLKGDPRLYSARVGTSHRALLLHAGDSDYLLVSVKHRKDVYEDLDRYEYQINRVTGGIEVFDLTPVGDSIVGRLLGTGDKPVEHVSQPALFAKVTDEDLLNLGVAEPLLPAIRRTRTEDELQAFMDEVPQLTAEVLLQIYSGATVDDVRQQVTAPVVAEDKVDPDDYLTAVNRPATPVTTDDEALQAMLDEPFARWQVYLHPTQRKLVERAYSGPTRVSGGPGTGKTIVALHRVAHLVNKLPAGTDRPILLTTFNRNLAADLRARLLTLGGEQVASRVDIVTIDKLAALVVREAGLGAGRRHIDDNRAAQEWRDMLFELDLPQWDPEFLNAEWGQVILGQVLTSRVDYFQARRVGRGRTLTRADRDQIWQLAERFTLRLEEKGVWTWRQIAAAAARAEMDRGEQRTSAGTNGHRYRHVVVDEAQDFNPAHWKMLRAMVAPASDDMFIVGDTHQRIYDNYASLGSLGINIRGRSSRLTRCYRTTCQILVVGLELLTGETYDDLDGGEDTLAGYRSLLRGPYAGSTTSTYPRSPRP
ncbi:UvrD-helicase domain-containing protein [Virgisporangium aurantiacum]|uniref:DNA helicase n=1 Tax=Virgisporangium aurantiacum TaxID=175570 RepID=A0A8J3ZKF1_9ACTN|nr:UvrD-helicase domain-containing protein [Virgisporangium aurantiacum]GIJ63095.1 DNA helicase [Virgisporangium aurantiacum]